MSLSTVLEEAAQGWGPSLGVSVKHLDSGESASVNGGELYPTASVFKLPVIVELYRQAERGVIHLDERVTLREEDKSPGSGILKELSEGTEMTLRDLTRLMMILSDNTATDMIVGRVGLEAVNGAMTGLGLRRTTVVADCRGLLFDLVGANDLPPEQKTLGRYQELSKGGADRGTWSLGTERNNVSTPDETTRLLELIATEKAASPASCREILSIMDRCQTGGYRIPKYIPAAKVKLTRKTGSLPGIRNDVGILTLKETGERIAFSCYTKGVSDAYAAEEAIARVGRAFYDHYSAKKG